jgi:hypothetical protein
LDTLLLVVDGLRVDVPLSGGRRTGVECGRAVVRDLSVRTDGESPSWTSTRVTLELGRGGRENTSPSMRVGDPAIAYGIAGRWEASSDTVLAIAELTHGA